MTIEQLQYFYAISVYKTFSQAAIEMNITQSSLSKQIAKLEYELDTCLFDRSHRQIVLTYEGEQLLKDVQDILKTYDNMMNHLQDIKEKEKKTMKIAMLPIFSQYNLAKKIHAFSKLHPDIHLTIDEIEERDIQHQLNYQDYDIYILRGYYDELQSFQHCLLYEDRLVCVLSCHHPLSKQSSIQVSDLKHEKLLLYPKYTAISRLSIEICQKAGFQPKVVRHGRLETILSAAKENEGIALMMKNSLHIFQLDGIKAIDFTQDIHSDILLYYRKQYHDDIIKQFIQFIQPNQ